MWWPTSSGTARGLSDRKTRPGNRHAVSPYPLRQGNPSAFRYPGPEPRRQKQFPVNLKIVFLIDIKHHLPQEAGGAQELQHCGHGNLPGLHMGNRLCPVERQGKATLERP